MRHKWLWFWFWLNMMVAGLNLFCWVALDTWYNLAGCVLNTASAGYILFCIKKIEAQNR